MMWYRWVSEEKQMMDETGNGLDGFNPERYSNANTAVSGQPELGDVVELEYSSNAGGAWESSDSITIRGELLYVTGGHTYTDRLTFVIDDPENSRRVAFQLDPDSVGRQNVKTLNASKTNRGRRIGKVVSVEFTGEPVNTVAPVVDTIRRVRSGDTISVNGEEYGVISTHASGPRDRPQNFSAIITTADGDEYELETKAYRDGPRFRERFNHDEGIDLDTASVQPARFRERWDDFDGELDSEDTTDAFPTPHGATEGERLTFTLTSEDGGDEQVSGTVTDVQRYSFKPSGDRDRDPMTKVELDDGREVKLRNTNRSSRTITRSRWELLDPEYRRIKAFVITRDEDGDSEYHHVEATDVEREDTEGGDDSDDGGEGVEADGSGEWNPEPAELRDSETDDMSGHARRNLEQMRMAERERNREDGEGGEDAALITDGGVATDGGGGGYPEDAHQKVKLKLADLDVVWMSGTRGDDGQFLAVWRDADATEDDLEKYHMVMSLAGYTDLNPRVLDGDPGGVQSDDVTVDVWKQKGEPMTDGGRVASGEINRLYLAVERAVGSRDVEIVPHRDGVEVEYSGYSEPITDALDDAGVEYASSHTAVGPFADHQQGRAYVTGFQDEPEGEPEPDPQNPVPCPREVWRTATDGRRIAISVQPDSRSVTPRVGRGDGEGVTITGVITNREKVGDAHVVYSRIVFAPDGELAPIELEAVKEGGEWEGFRAFAFQEPVDPRGPDDGAFRYIGAVDGLDIPEGRWNTEDTDGRGEREVVA